MLTLADVLDALTGIRPPWARQLITDATVDSRQVIPGALFVALPGEKVDGHDFVQNAFEKGAHFALIERELPEDIPVLDLRGDHAGKLATVLEPPFALRVENSLAALQKVAKYWRSRLNPRVVGITGSVGKSTTKELVAAILEQRYSTLKNPGNLNNEIGLPLTILRLGKGHQRAVLEMGFYVPGEIAFLCEIASPQIGVVTNIGTVHAERAGTQEDIAHGKAELVQALPPAPEGTAILNIDDPWVRWMATQTQARVFFYGFDPKADLWADQVEGLGLEGIRFRLHYGNEVLHLKVPLIGRHSVHTVLRAAAVGLVEGLTWHDIVRGLRYGHPQLRLVAVRSKRGALILDDTYNASPQSTMAALNLLEELSGRKIAVLGDMLELGRYEEIGHQKIGVRAAEVAEIIVTVGERARIIARTARRLRHPHQVVVDFTECEEAIAYLNERLQENDVVLVKGSRGMRMDRIVSALEKNE